MRSSCTLILCLLCSAFATDAQNENPLHPRPAAVLVSSGLLAQADSLAFRADSLVRVGRPWRATVLLSSRLTSPVGASPELLMSGARAAAAWGGWTEVERLLRTAPWLDHRFGGDGRELLTRGALERNVDALTDARLALTEAADERDRATRLVLLARAYDRANALDSAASNYLAAAARLPRVGDWLRIRAAGTTGDSVTRNALLARIASPLAHARVLATDAQARERALDYAGAARQFRRAGMEAAAFRVDALATRDSASRSTLAQRIVAYLGTSPRGTDLRQTLDVLDKLGRLPAPAALVVARAAAGAGAAPRAIAEFTLAEAEAPLSLSDRMTEAGALSRAGRFADAALAYGSVTTGQLAPTASYLRAKAFVQAGDGAAARAALRETIKAYATDASAAAPSLLLLADLHTDAGDIVKAAQTLHEVFTKFPASAQAPLARFRLGVIQWIDAPADAAKSFDSLATLFPRSDEALASRYWAARALSRIGKHRDAELLWKKIIQASPLTYYAMLSAERLHVVAWEPPAGADTAEHTAALDSVVTRITTLQRLGMDVEARFEMDALAEHADAVPTDAGTVAQALLEAGDPARGVRVALAALGRGVASRALYRLAYPVLHADALVEEARRNGLDPALVAGLIRQESSWNPHAVSVAGARGLMQLLPTVGASIASSHHYALWNPILLFEPDVNLELGTSHLASSLKKDMPVGRALAAYNAGGSRVSRWVQRPRTDDPELFAEWIPFSETRDYVRIVQRNAAVYRALYGL